MYNKIVLKTNTIYYKKKTNFYRNAQVKKDKNLHAFFIVYII